MNNPFQAPEARLTETPETQTGPRVYFLPWQVLLVGIFAGPIALIYMLRSNEVMLGRDARAKLTLILGIVLCVLAAPLVRSLNSIAGTTAVYAGLTVLAVLWTFQGQMPAIRGSSDRALGILSHAWSTLIIVTLASIGFSTMLAMVVFTALSIVFPSIL